MSELRKDNLQHADVLEHVSAYLEANGGYYSRLTVRCVSVLQNGTWTNVVCFVRAQPSIEKPVAESSKRYRTAHLLAENADLSQLAQLIRELPTGTITVDGEAVFLGGAVGLRSLAFQPSGSDYSDLPGYLYQTNQASQIFPAQLQGPLLGGIALRYYPNVYSAIPEWIGLRRFNELSDARLGYVWFFLPECRARFSRIERSVNQLRVAITRGANESTRKFHVIGNWKTTGSLSPISLAIPNASVDLQIPRDATTVDLYLVDETDTTFDYHQETEHWVIGKHRILPSSTGAREEYLDAARAASPHEIDAVTEIGNRAYLDSASRKLFAKCRADGVPCAALFMDTDNFKAFNTQYGHKVGDKVLHTVAQTARQAIDLRGGVIGRWGAGDEIVATMTNLTLPEVAALGERIRLAMEATPVDGMKVTVSVGVASSVGLASVEELWDQADKALNEAKQLGKNRVASYREAPAT